MASAAGKTKKATTPAAKKQWATVANKVLAESGNDAEAIKIANAAVAARKGGASPKARRSTKKGGK